VTTERVVGFNDAPYINDGALRVTTPFSQGTSLWYLTNDGSLIRGLRTVACPTVIQQASVGVNAGYAEALGQVGDAGTPNEEFTPQDSLTDDVNSPLGSGVDFKNGLVPRTSLQIGSTTFGYYGAKWKAGSGVVALPDGVYALHLQVQCVGGGYGVLRARLVAESGVEVMRASDNNGSAGARTSTAASQYATNCQINWTGSSSTITRLSGNFTLRVMFNTSEEPDGWLVTLHVSQLFPADPNAVYPAA